MAPEFRPAMLPPGAASQPSPRNWAVKASVRTLSISISVVGTGVGSGDALIYPDVNLVIVKERHPPSKGGRTAATREIDEGSCIGDEGIRIGNREVHHVGGIVDADAGIDRECSLRRNRRTVVADKSARGAHRDA